MKHVDCLLSEKGLLDPSSCLFRGCSVCVVCLPAPAEAASSDVRHVLAHVIYWQLPQQLPVHVLLCMQVLLPPCETTSSELRPFANLWDHSAVRASEAYQCANLLAFAFLPIPAKVYADTALVRCKDTHSL